MIGRGTTKRWSGNGINSVHQYVRSWCHIDGREQVVQLLGQETFVEFAFGFGGFELAAGYFVSLDRLMLRIIGCYRDTGRKERQQGIPEVQVYGKQDKISP